MQIEILYFEGCPHWRQSLKELNEVLKMVGIAEEVNLTQVNSIEEAERLEFLGSPTIRIEGSDVEPDIPGSGYGMECRIYWDDGKATGNPPRQWIAAAIDAAQE